MMNTQEMRQQMLVHAAEVTTSSREEFAGIIRNDLAKWTALGKAAPGADSSGRRANQDDSEEPTLVSAALPAPPYDRVRSARIVCSGRLGLRCRHRLSLPPRPVGRRHRAGRRRGRYARISAPRLAESMGQTWIVDNRAGAGGNVGVEIVARASPDG